MRIGILGAGNIGSTLARLLIKAGHEVALSNSRGPESLQPLIKKLGDQAHAMTAEQAADWGEIVMLAIPWRNKAALPPPERFANKVVIDAMNPYSAEGEVIDLGDSSSSEEVANQLPGARLVKAFNTMYFQSLARKGRASQRYDKRLAMYLAGDDLEAKKLVGALVDELGFAPINTGSLRDGGRLQQPGSPIYAKDLTGLQARELLTSMVPRPEAAAPQPAP